MDSRPGEGGVGWKPVPERTFAGRLPCAAPVLGPEQDVCTHVTDEETEGHTVARKGPTHSSTPGLLSRKPKLFPHF